MTTLDNPRLYPVHYIFEIDAGGMDWWASKALKGTLKPAPKPIPNKKALLLFLVHNDFSLESMLGACIESRPGPSEFAPDENVLYINRRTRRKK